MTSLPSGVQQILTTTGIGGTITQTPIPVLPGNWQKFCMLTDAQAILTKMLSVVPGATLAVVENTAEEGMLYTFASTDNTASPRVWMIQGLLADGSTVVGEYAGGMIDRQTNPQPFIDNTSGNPANNTLQYSIVAPGVAQFFYGAPVATA
jgi:hypothetical protein